MVCCKIISFAIENEEKVRSTLEGDKLIEDKTKSKMYCKKMTQSYDGVMMLLNIKKEIIIIYHKNINTLKLYCCIKYFLS